MRSKAGCLGTLISNWLWIVVLLGTSFVARPGSAGAEEPVVVEGTRPRTPCRDTDPVRRPYFGDLHVHTALSLDAATMGTANRPRDAYRFARGERIGIHPYHADGSPMRTVQLSRPLDFAAVTDHAELLGEVAICSTPGMPGYGSMLCRLYRGWPRAAFFWMNLQANRATRHDFCGAGGRLCLEAARGPWQETLEAAEDAYDRSAECAFTTFAGYEWTGAAGSGNNFHRNVIFANDVVPDLPISFIDEPELVAFWHRLGAGCLDAGNGCDAVVIPHNSNLSGGQMFRTEREDGTPMPRSEALDSHRYEPLVEVMQHKGDSECKLGLGNADELCDFEKVSESSFSGLFMPLMAEPPTARQFIRNVLREGLVQQQRLGVNPFYFGIVASSDSHLGTAGLVEESADYPGHGGAGTPPGEDVPVGLPDHIEFNPGGLAVLWAEQNTRSSLFAAMRRREVYGTSGPRIVVRFFGGWDLPDDLCGRPDLAATGYAHGVPMGGRLVATGPGRSPPIFAVSALADPGVGDSTGTPLQRVQIIKGWVDDDTSYERVYEVAGDPDNGARVDPDTCEAVGAGASSLCGVWRDPDFDPAHLAFYYARVIENPTCRWSQRLCLAAGVRCEDASTIGDGLEDCCSDRHRPIIQERAWTSPIWYQPTAP